MGKDHRDHMREKTPQQQHTEIQATENNIHNRPRPTTKRGFPENPTSVDERRTTLNTRTMNQRTPTHTQQ
eukprot:12918815-Prorocentrum_lima.AAC.1